jgi:hypothetical protein
MSQIVMENPQQYRVAMQAAALSFLQRHQGQHLDQEELAERTTRHLVEALDVPTFMASRLVHLALSQLHSGAEWVGLDLAAGADEHLVILVDTGSGQRALIPRRILSDAFLAQAGAR